MKGLVKFFNSTKGYGFIKGEDNEEYFVHVSGLVSKEIQQDDRVEFEITEGKKGLNAVQVKKS